MTGVTEKAWRLAPPPGFLCRRHGSRSTDGPVSYPVL